MHKSVAHALSLSKGLGLCSAQCGFGWQLVQSETIPLLSRHIQSSAALC
jgi:hypothetical protein